MDHFNNNQKYSFSFERISRWNVYFYLIIFIGILVWSLPFPFFWDNILLSSQLADYYYQSHFSSFLLPESLDTGHPPFWGMYVAMGWFLFGKHLWVGHFLMLPFLAGIIWQANRLVKHFVSAPFQFCVLGLILADPTWIAQSVQVSSDVAMLFFILLGIVSVLKNQCYILTISAFALILLSLRGVVYALELGFFALLWLYYHERKLKVFQIAVAFLPAVSVALFYYGFHWMDKGWIRYHQDSNWLTEAEMSGPIRFIKNMAISIWRIIDFGRIGIWIYMMAYAWIMCRKRQFNFEFWLVLSQVPLIFIIALSPEFVGHRYLMSLFFMGALVVGIWISKSKILSYSKKMTLFYVLIAMLLAGHYWPYPKQIAVGWDSTLAHVPYHNLKADMVKYLKEQKISVSETGSDFPNDAAIGYSDLSENMDVFPPKNLNTQSFILYSNVMNGFSDEEIQKLNEDWKILKREKAGRVEMVLYTNRKL